MRLAAACCLIKSYTASAFSGFSAVRAHANTVVNKISAVYATRQIFFVHQLSPLPINTVKASSELSFRKNNIRLYQKRKEKLFLSNEVVKCPEVIFFLKDYVFENASCCCIPAFECFSDNLPIKRYCAAF